MSEHTVKVTSFTEYHPNFENRTTGGIVVEPPVTSGDGYKSAVLGRDRYLVDLRHVENTATASVFLAESGRVGGPESRQADIRTIADRIGQLANNPESVIQMVESNPFPTPPKP
jgi:hypothetical protein